MTERSISRVILFALLWAIIIVGGAGMTAVALGNKATGIPAILISLMLGALAVMMIKRFPQAASYEPKPFNLNARRASAFVYFPGTPAGYVGYTDWWAMTGTLNDDLRLRPPREQFMLIGFAIGFVTTVVERAVAEGLNAPTELEVVAETREIASWIAWVRWVQLRGTDNFGPSSQNLLDGLSATRTDLCQSGAIVEKQVDKYFRQNDGPEAAPSRPSDELPDWISALDKAQKLGRQVALAGQFREPSSNVYRR